MYVCLHFQRATMTSCLHCLGAEAEVAERPLLEKLLPAGYSHLVCYYKDSAQTDSAHFRAYLKLKLTSEDDVHKWLKDFQRSSGQTWRKSKTYPNSGRYNAYRVDLRCEFNTFPKTVGKKTKNTSCSATMYLILKRHTHSQNRMSRSGDPHIKDGYLLSINLRHEHNHQLSGLDAAKKREVSDKTVAKVRVLLETDHTPSFALDTITYELQEREEVVVEDDWFQPLEVEHVPAHTHALIKCGAQESIDEGPSADRACLGSSVENLEGMIQQFCRNLTDKLKHDPNTFSAPVCAFLRTYSKMTDSSLISALRCFGEAPTRKSSNTNSAQLSAERKAAQGQRKAQMTRRPPKCSGKEHPYSKQRCRKRACNTFIECVENNVSLLPVP